MLFENLRTTKKTTMKISTWITPEPVEVDVEVSIEDIHEALEDSPETVSEAFKMLNRCCAVMRSISDEIIGDMNDAQRKVVREFLALQSERYSQHNDPVDLTGPLGGPNSKKDVVAG